jgi:hypothetical protein
MILGFTKHLQGQTQLVSLGMEKDFVGSQCVPMGTLSSQVVPNSTSVLSHVVYPKFNSHIYELKWSAIGEHNCSYFVTWGPKREANGKAQHAHDGPCVFLFGVGWGGVGWRGVVGVFFLFFNLVPNMFSACSLQVPQVPTLFDQSVPNSTSILSHMVCPKFSSHVYILKR